MIRPVNVGVIGCGTISSIYLQAGQTFEMLNIVACADLDLQRAQAQAAAYNIPRACSVAELLADPTIELVVNLTIPQAHAEIALAALEAGKSIYNEKPLAIHRADARRMLDLARERGLLVGGAPDTFLGGGLQTCRALLDAGTIGVPLAATAFMMGRGPERWHPNPDFFFQQGAGPMFDMGPYYLTALLTLLGPVRRVTGATRVTFPTRTITSQPLAGTTITVNTPTYVAGLLDFASGPIGTIITSFDITASQLPRIELYGSTGTLILPDPNTFGGPVRLYRSADEAWTEVPLTHGFTSNSRGIGVADMAYALRTGRPHRASGELAAHVLDIMHAIHEAAEAGRHIELESSCAIPAALPPDWPAQETALGAA